MLVSFIIPAYNAADTIVRCLDSIYNLSLERDEFEVIVIDDASTDDTCDVIERYVRDVLYMRSDANANNLSLLRQPKNNRQGAARNRGVSVAKGEYICFVDSDDVVAEGIVSAIRLSKELQTDMTAYHHAVANEYGQITKEEEKLLFVDGQIFSGIDMQNTHPYWCPGPAAYIYNRKFLDDVNYPFCEGVLYEDSDFVVAHLYYAKRMSYSRELGYLAYYREGSTTRSMTHKNLADYLLLGTRMLRLYDTIGHDMSLVNSCDKNAVTQFAEGILEGACWNTTWAIKSLVKLGNKVEIQAFYQRVDANINRLELYDEKRLHRYFWNIWTTIGLKHPRLATLLSIMAFPIYKMFKKNQK